MESSIHWQISRSTAAAKRARKRCKSEVIVILDGDKRAVRP